MHAMDTDAPITFSTLPLPEALLRFANRSCSVLVASDVAARGLDIDDLAAVVNYDVPSDPDTYMHRIGRTGRAGRDGLALTLCTPQELRRMEAIEDHQSRTLPRERAQLPQALARLRDGKIKGRRFRVATL